MASCTTLAHAATLVFVALLASGVLACTNFIVTKGASASGANIVTCAWDTGGAGGKIRS